MGIFGGEKCTQFRHKKVNIQKNCITKQSNIGNSRISIRFRESEGSDITALNTDMDVIKSNPPLTETANQELCWSPYGDNDNIPSENMNSAHSRNYPSIDLDEQSLQTDEQQQSSDDTSSLSSKLSFNTNHAPNNWQVIWTRCVLHMHKPLRYVLVESSVFAAKHPTSTIAAIATLAITLAIVGLLTNFQIENRDYKMWTPRGSLPDQHAQWIDSIFPMGNDPRQYYLNTLLHASGNNVVSYEGMQLQFAVMERIRSVPDYAEFCHEYGTPVCGESDDPSLNIACQWYGIPNGTNNRDCEVLGVTSFWFSNYTVFRNMVFTDADVQRTLSINLFPGRLSEFDISNIVGYPEFDGDKMLTRGKSFLTYIVLNRTDFDRAEALERSVTEELKQLQKEINTNSSNPFRLEVLATRSFEDEFVRGVYKDLVLLPLVGFFMTAFTCLVFYKHGDPLNSRVLLGMGATITVMVSIMTGYGLLFIVGVPFTSLAQVSVIFVYNDNCFLTAFSQDCPFARLAYS
jgi:Niemann-Pick C1 protein